MELKLLLLEQQLPVIVARVVAVEDPLLVMLGVVRLSYARDLCTGGIIVRPTDSATLVVVAVDVAAVLVRRYQDAQRVLAVHRGENVDNAAATTVLRLHRHVHTQTQTLAREA